MQVALAGIPYGYAPVQTSDTEDLLSKNVSVYSQMGLYVDGTGNVKVKTANGEDVTFTAVPANSIIPGAFLRVYTTGTTATGICCMVLGGR